MTKQDDVKFAECIAGMAEMFLNKEISGTLIALYFEALKDLSIEDIQKACSTLLNTHKFQTLPKPADIREALGLTNETKALQAWNMVIAAVRRHGTAMSMKFPDPVIHSVIEVMGGWIKLCMVPSDEMVWQQKEFERLYPLMAQRGNHPEMLIGEYHDKNNPLRCLVDMTDKLLIGD